MSRTSSQLLSAALVLLAVAALAAPAAAQAPPIVAKAVLTGASEVPPVPTTQEGVCYLTVPSEVDTAVIVCHHTIENVTAGHIHVGPPGVAGPPVVPFDDLGDPLEEVFTVPDGFVADLLAGNLYVNLHTAANPSGLIRGQLVPVIGTEDLRVTFRLTGDEETPPVETEHSGTCTATVMDDTETLLLACSHDIPETTAAHIHLAPAGEPGDIVVPLGDGTSPIFANVPLTDDLRDALAGGDLYVNVHTEANPGGEIRGQIAGCVEGGDALCLQDRRFRVTIDWTSAVDSGVGHAVPDTEDSGLFWFFNPDNREVLVKVLDGCGMANPRFWVFFSATTDVAFDLVVEDTLTGETKTYSNTLGNPADPVTDTNAFATCDVRTAPL